MEDSKLVDLKVVTQGDHLGHSQLSHNLLTEKLLGLY